MVAVKISLGLQGYTYFRFDLVRAYGLLWVGSGALSYHECMVCVTNAVGYAVLQRQWLPQHQDQQFPSAPAEASG